MLGFDSVNLIEIPHIRQSRDMEPTHMLIEIVSEKLLGKQ
jgi:hypothetical protein